MNELITALKAGECIVTYEKIDTGELREMHCTLNPTLIPNNYDLNQSDTSNEMVVWCIDRDAWRSFRVNTMKEWRVK